jgi:hypothetical protein
MLQHHNVTRFHSCGHQTPNKTSASHEQSGSVIILIYAGYTGKPSVISMRGSIKELLAELTSEKCHNFVETIELRIGVKNYDPQH